MKDDVVRSAKMVGSGTINASPSRYCNCQRNGFPCHQSVRKGTDHLLRDFRKSFVADSCPRYRRAQFPSVIPKSIFRTSRLFFYFLLLSLSPSRSLSSLRCFFSCFLSLWTYAKMWKVTTKRKNLVRCMCSKDEKTILIFVAAVFHSAYPIVYSE